MKKKTHQEFVSQLREIAPSIKVHGKYVNCSTKIEVGCSICHHVWSATPNSLLSGHGCPVCANNQKKTTEQFVAQMESYNPYLEILGEYKGARVPIAVRCKICENKWAVTPNRLLMGAQCMNCIKPHTSFMEQFMLLAFQEIVGEENVLSRNTSAIGLELDIYFPSYNLAIEPGAWLYHKEKLKTMIWLKEKSASKTT